MSVRFSNEHVQQSNASTDSLLSPRRSNKPFIVLGLLIGVFAISTVVLTAILTIKNNKFETIENDICLTPYCIKAANYLIESIDETVEPCEDFYHFTCGKWIRNTRISDDANVDNIFHLLRTELDHNIVDLLTSLPTNDTNELKSIGNARILYQSCVAEQKIEEEGVDSILTFVNTQFGGWPILQGLSWDNSSFNLGNLLLKLREYNNNIIFVITTSTDEKNSTERTVRIGQGDLSLGQKEYYFDESKITFAYRRLITEFATALTNDSTEIEKDVKDIYEFEKEIAKYHWTTVEQRIRANEKIRTTVGNLTQLLNTTFDFVNYLRSAYALANVTIFDNDTVTVDEVDYLKSVSSVLDQTSARVLQNYLIWRFMMHRIDNMPKRFRNIQQTFNHISHETVTERARTVMCGNYVNGNMGFAVSKLYIKKYFDENARNQSFEMINNIRKSFIDMLKTSTWMDSMSKRRAIEKAQAINEKIGYPDDLGSDNVTQLEEEYAEYIFDSSYINNVLKLLRLKTKEEFQTLRIPIDRREWPAAPPTVVNAFYAPSENQIIFPAGILQMPFFNKDAPKYLNYGGIGVAIGHEITHGFDDEGRQFDKDGNRIPWWTNKTIEKFIKRKTCIVEQYSNYTLPQMKMKINGNQTQGEDIADNGALREAFFAYRKFTQANPNVDKRLPGLSKYSPEQMFFINYARTWCTKMTDSYIRNSVLSNVHSLGQFRVLGPTSNFVEFDRAFSCKPGQGNSRVNKCIVW